MPPHLETAKVLDAESHQSMPRPYTVRSLAERWSCSEGMIRKMIKDGTLQCFTIGTLIRIPVAEVERIEAGSISAIVEDGGEPPPSHLPTDGRRVLPRARRPSPSGIGAEVRSPNR